VFVSPQDIGNFEPFCDGELEVWAMENFLPASNRPGPCQPASIRSPKWIS
jgi:hypothetical protein